MPRPAYEALCATLADGGLSLADMGADRLALAGRSGNPTDHQRDVLLTVQALPRSGWPRADRAHVLRHSAAKLRRDAGASIEAVSRFVDHSSLAVTSVYLRRLEGKADQTWPDVAVAIGV